MSDDTISRQAAINAICEHGTDLERRGITVLSVANHKQATVDLLENLPSAERRGRWIKDKNLYKCTACNDLLTVAGWADCIPEKQIYTAFKYCPNCGAKMDEVEEWIKK